MKIEKEPSNIYFDNYMLKEATNANVYRRLSDAEKSLAIISPYRSEYSTSENKVRMSKLKHDVRKLGYGFNQLLSRWTEDGVSTDEQSLLIPNITYKQAFNLATEYEQSSFIYKDKNGMREICTTPFENYKVGDVVRNYSLKQGELFNVDTVEKIFNPTDKDVLGAGSKLLKGSNAQPMQFKVTENLNSDTSFELYEVHSPKSSYFQTEYRLERIL